MAADALAAPPSTTHFQRVRVRGRTVEYRDTGHGDPLVLLHGHEQSASSWRRVTPALAGRRRVVAISLPGHGASEPLADHRPGADLAPFVGEVLDALGLGRVDLVGHSAGGAVAVRLALADPARVRTLTVVDGAGLGRQVHPLMSLLTLPGVAEAATVAGRMPGGALVRTTLAASLLFARPTAAPADFLAETRATGSRPGQLEASTAMARALFDVFGQRDLLLDRLERLALPVLVVWGQLDQLFPVRHAHDAVRRLRRGRLVVLPECGHLPHVERPAPFARALGRFLDDAA